ncbi:MAG: ATP-binding protein [Bacteroidota bacterium]
MDRIRNPFSPGAGVPPPALVGREAIIDAAAVALHRIRAGRSEKSQIMLGLRGVGKTVLLNHISDLAEDIGYLTIMMEAPESQALAAYLSPALKSTLIRLSRVEQAKAYTARAAAALRGFASAFQVSIGDLALGLTEIPTADSGNIEIDLPELLLATGRAARAAGSSVALFIDEIQYLSQDDFSALIVAFHRIAQKGLPLVLFGAGLPQVAALAGEAKSYAERLFAYPTVGALRPTAARRAIENPIQDEGAAITLDALQYISETTEGYPYFIQEWGKHAWNQAPRSPITISDVQVAGAEAVKTLDASFFRVRFDRLTPREQDYLRAMADLGPGPHRSGAIADRLGRKVEGMGPLRSGLIRKGMIWSPAHGDTAFTVPMFDQFMQRVMPDWSPSSRKKKKGKRAQ